MKEEGNADGMERRSADVDGTPDVPDVGSADQAGLLHEDGSEIRSMAEAELLEALDLTLSALRAIAREDDLVAANPEAFSVHAYRRCRQTAVWALDRAEELVALAEGEGDLSAGRVRDYNEIRKELGLPSRCEVCGGMNDVRDRGWIDDGIPMKTCAGCGDAPVTAEGS